MDLAAGLQEGGGSCSPHCIAGQVHERLPSPQVRHLLLGHHSCSTSKVEH